MAGKRKALALLGVSLGVIGLLFTGTVPIVAQTTPTATRSLSPDPVAPGGQVVVTIVVSDYGQYGGVVETLPAGFSYETSSLSDAAVRDSGQAVTFLLFGESSFTYTVTASDTAGDHTFSGALRDSQEVDHTVGGDNTIAVEATDPGDGDGDTGTTLPDAGGPSASRSLSPASVASGGEVVVTITAGGYGQFGGVVETLPAGFSYETSSLSDASVRDSGQTVTFLLFGEGSFTYTVTASDTAGEYTFSGVLRDSEEADHPIADSRITVEAAGGASASRSLSRASVVPGGEVVVTIVVSDYGQYGGVVETLPAGFGYETSSLSDSAVRDSGQTVTFLLFGESSFTYTVTASDTVGDYTFSGVLRDSEEADHPIADSRIKVEIPATATPTPTATATPAGPDTDPTRPEGPTATPTRPPQPTPTPIPTEVVPLAEITPIPMPAGDESVTAVVQPDRSTVVETPDGGVSLTFPSASRSTTFQVSVDASTEACESADYTSEVEQLLCVTVQLFDAQGNAESNVRLNRPVTLTMMFSPERERELGGFNTLYQAYLMGGLKLLIRDVPNGDWREAGPVRFELPDTVLTASISNFSTVSTFALVAVQEVFDQVSGKATPTPVATATPTTPDVGGVSMPSGLLLLLAICSGLLVVMGAWVLRRAPR